MYSNVAVIVVEIEGNKTSSSYGFKISFFRNFWGIVRVEICVMFEKFFENDIFPRIYTSFFVTLIPMLDSLLTQRDFRPISHYRVSL